MLQTHLNQVYSLVLAKRACRVLNALASTLKNTESCELFSRKTYIVRCGFLLQSKRTLFIPLPYFQPRTTL